jgi:drug/metabolite transporter (DMT)-like permease
VRVREYKGVVAYVLAATAAFVNALTSVLQRIGVETAPQDTTLRWSLMAHALRRGIWLIGFALMLVVFVLQATALRFGELSVVQPVLTTELLFLLLILMVWFHYRLTWQEWLGALTIVVGLGGFFLAARPSGGNAIPDPAQWTVALVILFSLIAGFIVAALRGPRWWRAAAFGAASAVCGASSTALTKSITTYITKGWGHVLVHPQPYLLAITGIGTVFLLQNALHAGPITASRISLSTVSPLAAIVLGVTLFGDRLRSGPLWTTLEVLAIGVLLGGVVVVARSPLVAGTHLAGDPGEMLGTARERAPAPVRRTPVPLDRPVVTPGVLEPQVVPATPVVTDTSTDPTIH